MSIGSQIRRRRKELGLSVRELAGSTGFSPSYVSLLERGLVNPSVAAIKKIAAELELPVGSLMDGPEHIPTGVGAVVRRDRRKGVLYPGSDIRFELLSPDLNRRLEPLWLTVPVGADSGDYGYEHEGEECLVVIKGRIELWLGDEKHLLEQGDSIYFDSAIPHRWLNTGNEVAEAVWVITPPTF